MGEHLTNGSFNLGYFAPVGNDSTNCSTQPTLVEHSHRATMNFPWKESSDTKPSCIDIFTNSAELTPVLRLLYYKPL